MKVSEFIVLHVVSLALWQYICSLSDDRNMDIKEKILDVSRTLFVKRGVRDVNIDEICRSLGMSKKTFYQYYESKEDLVGTMVDDHLHRMLEDFMTEVAGCSTVEILAKAFSHTPKMNIMLDKKIAEDMDRYYHEVFVSHMKKSARFFKDGMTKYMAKGIEEGVFRKDLDVQATMVNFILLHREMVKYISGDCICEGRKVSAKALVASMADMVRHTILSEKGWEEYENYEKTIKKKN